MIVKSVFVEQLDLIFFSITCEISFDGKESSFKKLEFSYIPDNNYMILKNKEVLKSFSLKERFLFKKRKKHLTSFFQKGISSLILCCKKEKFFDLDYFTESNYEKKVLFYNPYDIRLENGEEIQNFFLIYDKIKQIFVALRIQIKNQHTNSPIYFDDTLNSNKTFPITFLNTIELDNPSNIFNVIMEKNQKKKLKLLLK